MNELSYRPGLLYFNVMPGLEPEFYEPLLGPGLDAIIIGTVPTGGVPSEGKYSFIPFIGKATKLEIPVFLLRGSLSASRRPEHEQRCYRRDMGAIYMPEMLAIRAGEKSPEVHAIRAGATPLERPDISQEREVVEAIARVYSRRPGYHEGVREVGEIFSSPEFMEQLRSIREREL